MSNKRIDVMIDLETMGLGTNAPILSIGAIAFRASGDGLGATFHEGISLESTSGLPVAVALQALSAWMKSLPGVPYVWGNGANFDISILEQAYLDAGMRTPWGYRNVRCFRTVMSEFGIETDWVKPVVAHDALADAEAQARTLQNCMQRIRSVA